MWVHECACACVRLQTWRDIYSGDIHRFWMQIKLQQSFAGKLLLGNLCLLCNLVCRCFTSYVLAQYIYWTLWEHVAQLGFIYTLINKASGSGCDVTRKRERRSHCYLFTPPNTQAVNSHPVGSHTISCRKCCCKRSASVDRTKYHEGKIQMGSTKNMWSKCCSVIGQTFRLVPWRISHNLFRRLRNGASYVYLLRGHLQ